MTDVIMKDEGDFWYIDPMTPQAWPVVMAAHDESSDDDMWTEDAGWGAVKRFVCHEEVASELAQVLRGNGLIVEMV